MTAQAVLLLMVAAAAGGEEGPLGRLSEEAEVFAAAARRTIGKETLRQRAMLGKPRFRVGGQVKAPPRWQTREVVSEYGFSSFREAPEALHEFRQVVSVDGRAVTSSEKARVALAQGVTSEDDRLKQKMLRDFERHGLVGAALDFGQILLLFTRGGLTQYVFEQGGDGRIGADEAVILNFRQQEGPRGLTIFEGRKATRVPLTGSVWLRRRDSLPLRVTLVAERVEKERKIRDEAAVDYFQSPLGSVLPASVVHRQSVDGEMVVENHFTYSDFRRFSADAEIRFETQ